MKKLVFGALFVFSFFSLEARECGFYLFGGGGISSSLNIEYVSDDSAPGSPNPFDGYLMAANLTGSGSAGFGFDFAPWFGVQGDFIYWGNQDYFSSYNAGFNFFRTKIGGARTYSYGVEVVGYLLRCCSSVNPFVKVGYARYHSDWELKTSTGQPLPANDDSFSSFSNNGNGLIFGGGVSFPVNRCFDVTFQAQALYTDKQNVIVSHVTLYQYSLNLVYHFPNGCWNRRTMGTQKMYNRM